MINSNFIKINKKNINIIIKLLLFLYIIFAQHLENNVILKIVNDNGMKILIFLLIIYLISYDFTISLLVSICLIISILLYNKKNIDVLKNNKKIMDKIKKDKLNNNRQL